PQAGDGGGRDLRKQPGREAGPELDREDAGQYERGGGHRGPRRAPAPRRGLYSQRNSRAASARPTTAPTTSTARSRTGSPAAGGCRTACSPSDRAREGSKVSTGRADAGNLVSGKTMPPIPSSTRQIRFAMASVASARMVPASGSARPLNAAVPASTSTTTHTASAAPA